jgi:hypothetical protein
MEVINYKDFKTQHFKIINNNILYNDNELYLSTPTLKIYDIIDINNKSYLQLQFSKKVNSIYFINNILAIEHCMEKYISSNSLVINSQIIKDINDNIFIKIKIGSSLNNIFDNKKNPISYNSIKKNHRVKCIIKMNKLYTDSSKFKFGYSLDLYQLMIIS